MKVLTDKTKQLATLFNCRATHDGSKLFCGAVVFKGGISGELSLFNEQGKEFKIKIPESAKENNTYIIHSHPRDSFEIELVN